MIYWTDGLKSIYMVETKRLQQCIYNQHVYILLSFTVPSKYFLTHQLGHDSLSPKNWLGMYDFYMIILIFYT